MGRSRQIALAGASVALLLAGGAALAQEERGPECGWDVAAQRFVDNGAPAWVGFGGSPDFAETFIGGEHIEGENRDWRVLHHCPSDRYILIVADRSVSDRVGERFSAMLESETKYTMDEIAHELAALGAGVRRGQGDIGRCDCEFLASIRR